MKKKSSRILSLLLITLLALSVFGACGKKEEAATGASSEAKSESASSASSEAKSESATSDSSEAKSESATSASSEAKSESATSASSEAKPGHEITDREGNKVTIPDQVDRIVSLAPATTQVLESLGTLDRIVGVDNQTPLYVEGTDALPQFDMMQPDVEAIAALQPDIVFTTGMSYIDGDPYAALVDLGVPVVVIPSSDSIEGIKEDILFTAECVGETAAADPVIGLMEATIDQIAAIGETITEKKKVMFEISALPNIYSFGKGTYLNEMLEIIGAENVFADQESWIPVTEEDAVAANPDVILTSVNYIEDPVGEIKGRAGWENVTAVANGDVYYIDNASSTLPNQYIVVALLEMAEAIYPEAYAEELAEAA